MCPCIYNVMNYTDMGTGYRLCKKAKSLKLCLKQDELQTPAGNDVSISFCSSLSFLVNTIHFKVILNSNTFVIHPWRRNLAYCFRSSDTNAVSTSEIPETMAHTFRIWKVQVNLIHQLGSHLDGWRKQEFVLDTNNQDEQANVLLMETVSLVMDALQIMLQGTPQYIPRAPNSPTPKPSAICP